MADGQQIRDEVSLDTRQAQAAVRAYIGDLTGLINKIAKVDSGLKGLGKGIDVTNTLNTLSKQIAELTKKASDNKLTWKEATKAIEDSTSEYIKLIPYIRQSNIELTKLNKANEQNNKILSEQAILRAKQIGQTKLAVEVTSTRLGQLQREEIIAKESIKQLRQLSSSEERNVQIRNQINKARTLGIQIKEEEYRVNERNIKQLEREANYNSIMSVHAAKRAVGYTLLFGAIGAVTTASVAMTKNFLEADLTMRTMGAVLDLNINQAQKLSAEIRNLGGTYGGALKDIDNVALSLGRAGIATKDIIPATEIVLKMARLTGDTFEQSASAIISFQQVFGNTTPIEELGNKLAYIANVSRLSTQDIGTFANYALAAAQATGLTEDAVGGMAAAFSNAGVNASTIGTQIRTFSGILTEQTNDVKQLFNGIGVSQELLASKIRQGGKVSNDALLEFVGVLKSVDDAKFNKLTGSMDKLTANVLNLLRNNKDNLNTFVTDLQNGAENALSKVDLILGSHIVTWQSMWNGFLNFTNKGFNFVDKNASEAINNALRLKVEGQLESLKSVQGKMFFQGTDKEYEAKVKSLEKELDLMTKASMLQGLRAKLLEAENELVGKSGKEYDAILNKVIEFKVAIKDLELSIQEKGKTSKISAQEEEDNIRRNLAKANEQMKVMEANGAKESARYKVLTEDAKKYNEELIKLQKTSQSNTLMTPSGFKPSDIATQIKSLVDAGIQPSKEILDFFDKATNKILTTANEDMNTFFKNNQNNLGKELGYFTDIQNKLENRVATEQDFIGLVERGEQLRASAESTEIALTNAKKDGSGATKEQISLLQKQWDDAVNANNSFTATINKLMEVFGVQSAVLKQANDVKETLNASAQKMIDKDYEIQVEKIKQEGIKVGKQQSQIEKDILEAYKAKAIIGEDEIAQKDKTLTIEKMQTSIYEKQVSEAKARASEQTRSEKSVAREVKEKGKLLELELKRDLALAKLGKSQMSEEQYILRQKEIEIANANDLLALNEELLKTDANSIKAKQILADVAGKKLEAEANAQEKLNKLKMEALINDQQRADLLRQLAYSREQANPTGIVDTSYSSLGKNVGDASNRVEGIKEQLAMATEIADIKRLEQEYYRAEIELQNSKNAMKQKELEMAREIYAVTVVGNSELASGLNSFQASLYKLQDAEATYNKDKKEATLDQSLVEARYRKAQINGYVDMAGAMSSMFKQGSKEAEAFQRVQASLAMISGVTAVLEQGKGDPYTSWARMAAMAVQVASILSNAKIAFGGIGGSKTTTTSDAFSSMSANTGTGSVLGDTEAQSESITKAMEVLKDFAKPQYQTLQSMNSYLKNISDNIGGVTSLLIQSGGFAFGEGFTGFDTGYKNNLYTAKGGLAFDIAGNSVLGQVMGLDINKFINSIPILGDLNKMTAGILNSVVGGLFGKTSVSQALTDSGIYFADTFLKSAIEQLNGSAYQTISTTVKTKSWFGSSESTSISTYFQDLDNETERQFSLVLASLYDTVLASGDALDTNTEYLESKLDKFVVSLGKISLQGKTGDQIQETLTSIFGKIGDDIAKTAFPLLTPFQKVGEGMFETLTRVATGMEEAEYYINRLGNSFEDLTYTDILNKQGDVGFEALLQSIIKTDEALYGMDNNLVKIIETLDSTAEELYITYTALDVFRATLNFLKVDTQALSFATIRGAGSIDALTTGVNDYIENFLTEGEQLAHSTMLVVKEFDKLNISMPTSKEGFKNLISSLDLSTESGQELYGRLITLSGAFAEVSDGVVKSIETIQSELDTLVNNAQSTFLDSFSAIFDSIESMAEDTRNLITNLTTNSSNATMYEKLVKYNQLQADFLQASNGTDTAKTESIYTELLGLSQSLGEDNLYTSSIINDLNKNLDIFNDKEKVIRVNIVEGLGGLLGLNQEQVQQLKTVASDGKITNTELEAINTFSSNQWNELLSINSKGIKVTDNQIMGLSTLNREQKEALLQSNKDNLITNKELSAINGLTSLNYGELFNINNDGIKVTDAQIASLATLSNEQKAELIKANADGVITNKELSSLNGLTQTQKDGIVKFASESQYFSTEETLYSLNEYMRKQLEVLQKTQAEETERLSSKTFTYGDYIGKQEQIDIANRLGMSYESAKPIVEQLQALSISKNPRADIEKIVGFNGEDFTNWNAWNQLVAFDPEHSLNIQGFGDQIYREGQANKNARLQSEAIQKAFEQAKAEFYTRYTPALDSYNVALDNYNRAYQNEQAYGWGRGSRVADDQQWGWEALAWWNEAQAQFGTASSLLKQLQDEKALKGYAVGSTYIPNDQVAQIHKGEMIIPKTFSDGIRSGDLSLSRGSSSPVIINNSELIDEIKLLRQENKEMKQLMVTLTANSGKQLNTQRALLSVQTSE